METLHVYNTLSRSKEKFEPLVPGFVGLYVCGPTVYGPPHLGHARSALSFDTLYRFLLKSGYKVRYVRNITDVGHLLGDADAGEDKLQVKAKVEQLEPMEVAQIYTNLYHKQLGRMNMMRPSIEPHATGHIPEQIKMVQEILENGFAYESNGSIYFDVRKYNEKFNYGLLSGRNIEEMCADYTDRELEGQSEKRFPADFALWKKAEPNHLMRWESPWGEGFPGWHLECTVMSTKYLGTKYDIHGGGLDLEFPHHEAEIAQSNACINDPHSHHLNEAKYWMHNNMITLMGEKMSKSKGNAIDLEMMFTGDHDLLEQAYSPMVIRFFMLQAHYRSPLDFSNTALQAAEKALKRLGDGFNRLAELKPSDFPSIEVNKEKEKLLAGFGKESTGFMNDDLNTARVIAKMFDVIPVINEAAANKTKPFPVSEAVFEEFKKEFNSFFTDVLGLIPEGGDGQADSKTSELMELLIEIRKEARNNKDFALSDKIRDELASIDIKIKDTPQGTEWHVEA